MTETIIRPSPVMEGEAKDEDRLAIALLSLVTDMIRPAILATLRRLQPGTEWIIGGPRTWHDESGHVTGWAYAVAPSGPVLRRYRTIDGVGSHRWVEHDDAPITTSQLVAGLREYSPWRSTTEVARSVVETIRVILSGTSTGSTAAERRVAKLEGIVAILDGRA